MLKYLNIIEYLRVSRRVPLLLGLVFWLLLIVGTIPFKLFGFNSTGWGWVIPLFISVTIIIIKRGKIHFPFYIWIIWFLVVLAGLTRPHVFSLQSTLQIITPVIIGVAISKTYKSFTSAEIVEFIERTFVLWLIIIPVVKLPQLLLGIVPDVTGLAVEGITSLFFQAIFLTLYLNLRIRKYLVFYLLALLVPVIALTRGPMLASLVLLAFTLGSLSLIRRLAIISFAILLGFILFHSDRFQMKSFRKTDVSMSEVIENPDLMRTTGRKYMWKLTVVDSGDYNTWWGEGSNAAVARAISIGYKRNYLLHNDWLRIKYDYGIIGIIIFGLTIFAQVLHSKKFLRQKPLIIQTLGLGSISAFFPFMAVMYTDNILIYAHSFGSLQFAILGLVYSIQASEKDEELLET